MLDAPDLYAPPHPEYIVRMAGIVDPRDPILRELETLSMRARVAYGIRSIEMLASSVHSPWMVGTIALLWECTSAEFLDLWDERVRQRLGPLIDHHPSPTGVPEIDELPSDLKEALLLIEDAGSMDLYAALVGRATKMLEPVGGIIEILRSRGLELPLVDPFRCSSFEEDDGWGRARDPEEYRGRGRR